MQKLPPCPWLCSIRRTWSTSAGRIAHCPAAHVAVPLTDVLPQTETCPSQLLLSIRYVLDNVLKPWHDLSSYILIEQECSTRKSNPLFHPGLNADFCLTAFESNFKNHDWQDKDPNSY